MKIVNVTPHPINFRTEAGEEFEIAPSGVIVNAMAVEESAGQHGCGAKLVRVRFVPDAASTEAVDRLERENPGCIIVGSMIAAQGFPGRVVAMVATPGYERRPPAEKRMRPDKFTVF
jgi:hypothetical protein